MGGRGGSSGIGPRVQSLDEFLGRRGLRSSISDFNLDKGRLPHGETLRQQKSRQRAAEQAQADHEAKRAAATAEYNKLVAAGKLRAPTRVESLLKTAKGNSDNPSVQAARRALEKRGINWKTGRKKRT